MLELELGIGANNCRYFTIRPIGQIESLGRADERLRWFDLSTLTSLVIDLSYWETINDPLWYQLKCLIAYLRKLCREKGINLQIIG